MRVFLRAVLFVYLLGGLSACIYVDVSQPLDTDLDKTELGSKVGEASAYGLFWAVAWGDAGTKAAAENGGITVINHADRRRFGVLFGLYAKETTIVYGD